MSMARDVAPGPILQPTCPPHPHHTAQFYSDDDFLLESLGQSLGTALEGGAAAVVIATKAHRDVLAHRLTGAGVALASAVEQGRYLALDAAESLSQFMTDGVPEPGRFEQFLRGVLNRALAACHDDHAQVKVFGEMVALLWAEGKFEAALQLEELWNKLMHEEAFSLHCAYPIAQFQREEHSDLLLKICAEHGWVVPAEDYAALSSEEERLRNVIQLQQKAQVLETARAERGEALAALRVAQRELQLRVKERTTQLQERNLQVLQQAESLAAANRNLRQLSTRLLHLQEEERRRIAGELHEGVGQELALLNMSLSQVEKTAGEQCPALLPEITESVEIARRVCNQLRTMSYLLYPPLLEEMGLESVLRWYAEGFSKRSGIELSVRVAGELGRLSREQEIALFRVVQECLSNIHRHAGSASARISLSRAAHNVTLEVADDGIGLTPEQVAKICRGTLGIGLRSIKERIEDLGGALVITSQPRGTQVTAVVPTPENSRV